MANLITHKVTLELLFKNYNNNNIIDIKLYIHKISLLTLKTVNKINNLMHILVKTYKR
jgi:hypothetical protein